MDQENIAAICIKNFFAASIDASTGVGKGFYFGGIVQEFEMI